MSSVILQIIGEDGRLVTKRGDWSEHYDDMLLVVSETIDNLPEDKIVFLVVDMYSTYKERKKLPSEIIIEEQVKKIEAKQMELL